MKEFEIIDIMLNLIWKFVYSEKKNKLKNKSNQKTNQKLKNFFKITNIKLRTDQLSLFTTSQLAFVLNYTRPPAPTPQKFQFEDFYFPIDDTFDRIGDAVIFQNQTR